MPESINNHRFTRVRRKRLQLEGVYSVLPTPFTAAGDLDEASLRRVVDLFIGAGRQRRDGARRHRRGGAARRSERRRVLEVVTSHVNGRIGVVAGTTAEGTRTCIDYSRHAQGGRRDRGHGQPAAHAEAQLRGGRAPLPRAGRGGGHRDRRAGLPADLRLRDGAVAARAHRERDSARADDQARGSADAVQDVAHPARSRRSAASTMSGSSAGLAACSCSRSCWPAPPAR